MTPDVVLVQGDQLPALDGTIFLTLTKAPMDLTDAVSVRFQMRRPNDRRYTIDAPAQFVQRAEGKVRYEWAANDLAATGLFQAQWEITWPGNKTQTTHPLNLVEIRRQ